MKLAACPLCDALGGVLVFQAEKFRIVRAEEVGFPAFYRLVWTDHVVEFSDLAAADRVLCMQAVAAVELAMREVLHPTKVNLAALGNVVAHLHWHIIARFDWDSHFPAPVWATPRLEPAADKLLALQQRSGTLEQVMVQRLGALHQHAAGHDG